MDAVDYILKALKENLELERELGTRRVEVDRAVLTLAGASSSKAATVRAEADLPPPKPTPPKPAPPVEDTTPNSSGTIFPLVFLHHAALKPKGVEMMAKIIQALGETAESTPIVFCGPKPAARVYVVLGGKALRQWYPNVAAKPGDWLTMPSGDVVLVTYSPEYILQFPVVTPAVKKIKHEMWGCLQAAKAESQGVRALRRNGI